MNTAGHPSRAEPPTQIIGAERQTRLVHDETFPRSHRMPQSYPPIPFSARPLLLFWYPLLWSQSCVCQFGDAVKQSSLLTYPMSVFGCSSSSLKDVEWY